jgi:hypothetical protein
MRELPDGLAVGQKAFEQTHGLEEFEGLRRELERLQQRTFV